MAYAIPFQDAYSNVRLSFHHTRAVKDGAKEPLLGRGGDSLGMSHSVDEQDTVAQTTAPFHWLLHVDGNARVVNLVSVSLLNNDNNINKL